MAHPEPSNRVATSHMRLFKLSPSLRKFKGTVLATVDQFPGTHSSNEPSGSIFFFLVRWVCSIFYISLKWTKPLPLRTPNPSSSPLPSPLLSTAAVFHLSVQMFPATKKEGKRQEVTACLAECLPRAQPSGSPNRPHSGHCEHPATHTRHFTEDKGLVQQLWEGSG